MLTKHFRIALRTMRKSPVYACLNIGGLALGIAATFVLGLYVKQELTYDRQFEDHDRIFRVATDFMNMGGFAVSQQQLADLLPNASVDVEQTTRVERGQPIDVFVANQTFQESEYLLVDSAFFNVFAYSFVAGTPATALVAPQDAVLSEELALKYFGSTTAAVGSTIMVGKERVAHRITSVVNVPRGKTHLSAKLWLPMERPEPETNWTNASYYTYVKMRSGSQQAELQRGLDVILRDYAYPSSQSSMTFEEWQATPNAVRFFIQPLTDIYLHSDLNFELSPGGSPTQVYILGLIGMFILLIAGVNYVNLTTARSSIRAREVVVKKTLGAKQSDLVRQFITESVVFSLLAMVMAAAITESMLTAFTYITGAPLVDSVFGNPLHLVALLGFSILVGLIAGVYPAFFLAGYRPSKLLMGDGLARGNRNLRRGLVIGQFTLAMILGITSLVVYQQLDYMMSKDKGMSQDGVLVIRNIADLGPNADAFRAELERQSQVQQTSFANRIPTSTGIWIGTFKTPAMDDDLTIQMFPADENYISTLGMRLVQGRNFSADLASDSSALILNEAATRILGIADDPIGKIINDTDVVIGVVSDFHFQSLRRRIEPTIMSYSDTKRQLAAKLTGAGMGDFIADLPVLWNQFNPEAPIQYSFLDDNFAKLASQERMLSRAIGFFTLLAIVIACLGLFGLASFTAERRTKEIGVRKVLGASVGGIVLLLSKDFARLVVIALVISVPLSYLAAQRWLDDFAYRIDLGPAPFLVAGLASLAIATVSISYQSIRAATADPVKSLRYE